MSVSGKSSTIISMNTQRLRNHVQRLRRDDSGFTLIEVLTVTVIIGILSSIAIPTLRSQTSKGQGATASSDLRNAATAMESYFSDHGLYGSASDLATDEAHALALDRTTVVIVSAQRLGVLPCGPAQHPDARQPRRAAGRGTALVRQRGRWSAADRYDELPDDHRGGQRLADGPR